MGTVLSAAALRRELAARALQHAHTHPFEATHGALPSILFQPQQGEHGNFDPASYAAILANPSWSARLNKAYTGARRIPHRHHPERDRKRRELDCAVSSDALLMNIFCHPETLASRSLRLLLGLGNHEAPQPLFGYRPQLPMALGRSKKPLTDRTEIDLLLGPLLIEAKLTETGFQRAPLAAVQRYPAFAELFDVDALPITSAAFPEPEPSSASTSEDTHYSANDLCWHPEPDLPPNLPVSRRTANRQPTLDSYQLVRGVLAAHHEEKRFVVLCDSRRGDLIERWFRILRAVRYAELRSRCALLTWQELAAALPASLQSFLAAKYGILPG